MTNLPLSPDPVYASQLRTAPTRRNLSVDWRQARRRIARSIRDLHFDSTSPSQHAIAEHHDLHDLQH